MANSISILVALIRLVLFLFVLPATITYWHLRYVQRTHGHLLFVGPATIIDNNNVSTTTDVVSNTTTTTTTRVNLYGIYRGRITTSSTSISTSEQEEDEEPTVFVRVVSLPHGHVRWPSIGRVSTTIATPTSTLLLIRQSYDDSSSSSSSSAAAAAHIAYDPRQRTWCAQTTTSTTTIRTNSSRSDPTIVQVCSSPTTVGDSIIISDNHQPLRRPRPPSGIWTNTDGIAIDVSYDGGNRNNDVTRTVVTNGSGAVVATANTTKLTFRRNPNNQRVNNNNNKNRNVQQVLRHPTTFLLMIMNVGIALVYWNNRYITPNMVSKSYNSILLNGQYWRTFTGAMSHFDLWHIGFNIMTLHSLGMELEPSLGSVPFLLYNLSLIVLTTTIMMMLVYCQIRMTNNLTWGTVSSVGYSAVLFAWMVVATLERPVSCPILFMPDVCFPTHSFAIFGGGGGRGMTLRFNVGPLIQLVVAQVVLRRVSFVGHLAGIVAGFMLHWNLLPLEVVQPQVLIPAMYLLLLWRAKRLIPIRPRRQQQQHDNGNDENGDGNDDDADDPLRMEPSSSSLVSSSGPLDGRRRTLQQQRRRNNDEVTVHLLLLRVRTALVISILVSAMTFDVLGGMVWAPLLGIGFFQCCVQSHDLLVRFSSSSSEGSSTAYETEKRRLGTLWKGFILSSVLTIVCDSMTLPAWMFSSVYWQTDRGRPTVGLMSACLVLTFRLTVELFALIVACKNLADINETGGGIFVVVFGSTVLENAKVVGTAITSRLLKGRNFTPFIGQGISLGTVNTSNEATTSCV